MFGLGLFEIIIILAALLIVVGPDKLPGMAVQLAKFVRQCRLMIYDIKFKLNERPTHTHLTHETREEPQPPAPSDRAS